MALKALCSLHDASAHTCSRSIAAAKLAGLGSHRKPVRLCTTLSRGPPLLHAMTGRPAAIA